MAWLVAKSPVPPGRFHRDWTNIRASEMRQTRMTGAQWLAKHDPEHSKRKPKKNASRGPLRSKLRHKQDRAWKKKPKSLDAKANARKVSEADIRAAQTAQGGWTREQLAQWGVPCPTPKGWKTALL